MPGLTMHETKPRSSMLRGFVIFSVNIARQYFWRS